MTIREYMQKLMIHVLFTIFISSLYSCAGPADPFGSKEVSSVFEEELEKAKVANQNIFKHYSKFSLNRNPAGNFDNDENAQTIAKDHEFISIEFTPGRQNFHEAFDFQIHVRDQIGISQSHKLQIYYNDLEISESQYNNFIKKMHKDGKGFTLTYNDFRLPVKDFHHIKALFWRNENTPPIIETFEEPYCEVQGESRKIASMGPFSKHYETFRLIRSISNPQNINPNFIAAIVAKESSFNPKAVSWAKALGLTQVTPIAAKEIKKRKKVHWKVYPEVEEMSFLRLKSAVATGLINEKNDWRLDKRKSIQGAIHYLEYLENYWQRAKIGHEVNFDSELETDLILASYNSGAARVKHIYLNDPEQWYEHNDLKEAKKYFRKIKSYCYSFEHPTGS